MTGDLRELVEAAIGLNVDCGGVEGVHRVRDAVMAVVQPELDQLRRELRIKERTIRDLHDGINRIANEAQGVQVQLSEALAWKAKAGALIDPCECCTFGHHHTPCTCLGLLVCCHPESHDHPAEPACCGNRACTCGPDDTCECRPPIPEVVRGGRRITRPVAPADSLREGACSHVALGDPLCDECA